MEDNVLTESADAATLAATQRPDGGAPAENAPTQDLLSLILTSLDDDKAEDVVTIDLKGRSSIADHMIIASGRSSRQVTAIAEHLADKVKAGTGTPVRMEGKDTGDWVLLDCGDAIVHVFRPEVRDFYQLEKMWLTPEEQARQTTTGA